MVLNKSQISGSSQKGYSLSHTSQKKMWGQNSPPLLPCRISHSHWWCAGTVHMGPGQSWISSDFASRLLKSGHLNLAMVGIFTPLKLISTYTIETDKGFLPHLGERVYQHTTEYSKRLQILFQSHFSSNGSKVTYLLKSLLKWGLEKGRRNIWKAKKIYLWYEF